MARMTSETWEFLRAYGTDVFGAQDEILANLGVEAADAGLPPIAVSADVGRLLMILASLTRGRLAVEIGTLGGYSGIWICRGLAEDGRLLTIERDERHADFAIRQFTRAGLADRVDLRRGPALAVLAELEHELAPGSVDLLFIDAAKGEYESYFEIARPWVAVGGLVIADNVYGVGVGWIDQGHGTDSFNRRVASDPDFEAVAVPLREGLLIALRVR